MDSKDDHSSSHEHDDHAPLDLAKQIRVYLRIGAILIAGTVLTIAVAYVPWLQTGNHHIDMVIGLLIATVKVSLVALIFMHLNHEKGLIYKVLFFTVVFAAAMLFLFVLAQMDGHI